MRKEYLVLLAAGCVAANAANVNYDLLGRKGSKMNSPMVYKNVDYSKMKKTEQNKTVSSLESASLAKVGLDNGFTGIEGGYDSRANGTNKYIFRQYYPTYSGALSSYDWNGYVNVSNSTFIDINPVVELNHPLYPGITSSSVDGPLSPNYPGWTHADAQYGYSLTDWNAIDLNNYTFPYNHASDFESGLHPYAPLLSVKLGLSYENQVQNWFDNKATDVGVYMSADALPVQLGYGKFVYYFKNGNSHSYSPYPGYEMRESRTHYLITAASTHESNGYNPSNPFLSHSLIYVGNNNPSNPAGQFPQIYMGVRSNNIKSANQYNSKARELDNFIFNNRTIEFVPSGNYGQHSGYGNPTMNERAFASNAITVGALDQTSKVATYTSTATNWYGAYKGTQKPEIFNFSRLFVTDDLTRAYSKPGVQKNTYEPFYDGTEVSAAYTAGMVSNLLAVNPFYRWHPEVVKALLISSNDGFAVNPPYVDHPVTRTAPSYKYLVFDDVGAKSFDYYSRYWNGDINQMKTRTKDGKAEIIFIIENFKNASGSYRPFNAAISWLNSGDDIANNQGKVPQDFDLYVYGTNLNRLDAAAEPTWVKIASSTIVGNSFESVQNVQTNRKYLVFKIVLDTDNISSSSVNKNQIVLGFNASSAK